MIGKTKKGGSTSLITELLIIVLVILTVTFFKYKNSDNTKQILNHCYSTNEVSDICTIYKTLFGWTYKK